MKKGIVLMLILALLFSIGCGKKEETINEEPVIGNEDTGLDEETEVPETEVSEDKVSDDEEKSTDEVKTDGQVSLRELISTTKGDFTNFYVELVSTTNGIEAAPMELWVSESKVKMEMDGQMIIVDRDNGLSSVYMSETNIVIINKLETEPDFSTPVTFMSDIEEDELDIAKFVGKEIFDGKNVSVYETSLMGVTSKYYIWDEYNVLIRVYVTVEDMTTDIVFRNLTFGNVVDEDFTYPEGAEIMDLTNIGN